MTCPKCGRDNTSNNYCVYCGFRFGSSVAKYVKFDNSNSVNNNKEKISQVGLIPLLVSLVNFSLTPIIIKLLDNILFSISFFDSVSEKIGIESFYIPVSIIAIYFVISAIFFFKSYSTYSRRGVTKLRQVILVLLLIIVILLIIFYIAPFIWDYISQYDIV